MAKQIQAVPTRVGIDALEGDIAKLVREHRQSPPPPPIPVTSDGPLSDGAKQLKSKSVIMGAETMSNDAKKAAEAYLADAMALKEEVDRWCEALQKQAHEMAEHIARHHDSLRQAQKLIRQAMTQTEPPVEDIPNPLPGTGGTSGAGGGAGRAIVREGNQYRYLDTGALVPTNELPPKEESSS